MHPSIGKNLTGKEAKAQTYVLRRFLDKYTTTYRQV